MGSNRHPRATVHHFAEPFTFETPFMGHSGTIPELYVAYEVWGDRRNPAVLIGHALSQNTHATDLEHPDDDRKSWWSSMVGPGRVIDTNRFYVICINMLGGCGGSSGPATIDPDTGRPFGLNFPIVTVGDMVRSQKRLLDALGIERLYAVIGGSLGGYQALEWAIMYPDFVERIVPLGAAGCTNQFMIMTNRVQIDAIQMDCNYNHGNYNDKDDSLTGLAIARMVGFTTFISPITMERKFAKYHESQREPIRDSDFHEQMFHEAEDYLRRVSGPFSKIFDANSMVYLLQTWNHFDLAKKYGSLAQAFRDVQAKTLMICATGDNLFPPYLSEDVYKAMQVNDKPARVLLIDEEYGHDFFLIPDIIFEKISPPLKEFLDE
ncbi:MAG: homoserine O-acetyltransferase [SAR324 cluster bacterium]|nr:homoserine O-acetyltransferase [SAR324 cluster bacterium]